MFAFGTLLFLSPFNDPGWRPRRLTPQGLKDIFCRLKLFAGEAHHHHHPPKALDVLQQRTLYLLLLRRRWYTKGKSLFLCCSGNLHKPGSFSRQESGGERWKGGGADWRLGEGYWAPGVDRAVARRAERQGVCCLAAFYRGRASPAELRSGPSQWHTGGGRWRSVQTKVRRVNRVRVRVGEKKVRVGGGEGGDSWREPVTGGVAFEPALYLYSTSEWSLTGSV